MLHVQRVRVIIYFLMVATTMLVLSIIVRQINRPSIDSIRSDTLHAMRNNVASPEKFQLMLQDRDKESSNIKPKVDCRAVLRYCANDSDCDLLCDKTILDPNTRYKCDEDSTNDIIKTCRVRPVSSSSAEHVSKCPPESKGFINVYQVDPVTNKRRWRCYNTKPLLYKDDGSFQPWVCNGRGVNQNGHCDCPPGEQSFVHFYDTNQIPFCGPKQLNKIFLSLIPSRT